MVDYDENEPILLYDADQKAYVPARQQRRETGHAAYRMKPPGASNTTDDAIEEEDVTAVARALLIDRRPVRIRPLTGGTPNYLTFGGQKLVGYRIRPDIAAAIGLPAKSEKAAEIATITTSLHWP